MPPDPKPTTQPDQKPPRTMVPCKSVQFLPPMTLEVPGKGPTNSVKTGKPGPSQFWSVAFDDRAQRVVIAYFKPGPDPARAPHETRSYPAHACILEHA